MVEYKHVHAYIDVPVCINICLCICVYMYTSTYIVINSPYPTLGQYCYGKESCFRSNKVTGRKIVFYMLNLCIN